MGLFRKKPVVIEATQWWPGIPIVGVVEEERQGEAEDGSSKVFPAWIGTLENWHGVSPGDWIITGVKGERYPCKPDIFEASYEPVDG